jgi:hypothetical protein
LKTALIADVIIKNTLSKIISIAKELKTDPVIPSITEWTKANRYLPAGTTERPRLWSADFVPYT